MPPHAALEGLCLWSEALFLWWGWAQLSMAALTNGFTALVSINEGHDGAQGHVWVIPDALQVVDGILDALCKESPHGHALNSPGLEDRRLHGRDMGVLIRAALGLTPPGFPWKQRTN